MTENLIYEALLENSYVAQRFATYGNAPAIFLSPAPVPEDEKWGAEQFPRAEIITHAQYSPDRQVHECLKIIISGSVNQNESLKELTDLVRNTLDGIFITAEGETTVCVVWKHTEQIKQDRELGIVQTDVEFEALGFPKWTQAIPNPIDALNLWVKQAIPDVLVIGVDTIQKYHIATNQAPVLYFRPLYMESSIRYVSAAAWINAAVVCHIFASETTARENLAKIIAGKLALQGEILLADKSPLQLERITQKTTANPLSEGQIEIVGKYGLLKEIIHADLLNHITLAKRGGITLELP